MQLELSDISKNYGKIKILDNISLTLSEGIYGLVGVNGAGKTTLMKIIANNLKADTGKILFLDGQDYYELNNIGYLPQNFKGFPSFTVYELMKYVSILKGCENNNDREINNILNLLNLEKQRNKKISKLSGGMIRRLGIAQSILNSPKLVLLDEPTTGLDPIERNEFKKLLRSISKGCIIIISTHILKDLEDIADDIIILKDTKLTKFKSGKNLEKEILERYR